MKVFVNPSIMADTGMDKGALITITCLSAAIGSLIAVFWANAPLGLAPGMGLNAFFTYTLVIGKGIPWETALGVVFISGLFFLIMSIGGIRGRIAQAIPVELKIASTAGIGLFIAFIGLINCSKPGNICITGEIYSYSCFRSGRNYGVSPAGA